MEKYLREPQRAGNGGSETDRTYLLLGVGRERGQARCPGRKKWYLNQNLDMRKEAEGILTEIRCEWGCAHRVRPLGCLAPMD